jgi:hypothetical protein
LSDLSLLLSLSLSPCSREGDEGGIELNEKCSPQSPSAGCRPDCSEMVQGSGPGRLRVRVILPVGWHGPWQRMSLGPGGSTSVSLSRLRSRSSTGSGSGTGTGISGV